MSFVIVRCVYRLQSWDGRRKGGWFVAATEPTVGLSGHI